MQYQRVCLESFGYVLPEEVVRSDQLESRLKPLYDRLRLPEGRLELMSGISERRFWAPGTLPSQKSVESAELALQAAGWDRSQIGALVHGSVCRDHLEPATACRVHHLLDLPRDCLIYDVSNACLGLLNGLLQVANMIELGQINAGLVVGTESGRPLVDATIEMLNGDQSLTRQQTKSAFASLTIGSGSCAILLVDERLSGTGNRLMAAQAGCETRFHDLCQSGRDDAVGAGMRPLMETDSERLMSEGIATGQRTYQAFLDRCGWLPEEVDKTFCHQVGGTHRRLMLERLGIPLERDFSTLKWLGNTGSVALPMTMAVGLQHGHLAADDRVAMLGIGSGINCLMLAAQWQTSLVDSTPASHAWSREKQATVKH